MKQILCFGDSNTYGLIPKTTNRYPWGTRWTSVLNERLGLEKYRVVEEGLCGRTTVFDDPLRDGRCGVKVLPEILETHRPSELVIIMLGTNDCKTVYGASAELIGKGVERLISQTRQYAPTSKILIISPIHLGECVWKSEYDPEFSANSIEVSKRLGNVYREVSQKHHTYFLDASEYAIPSTVDYEHLNEENHKQLAEVIYQKVNQII